MSVRDARREGTANLIARGQKVFLILFRVRCNFLEAAIAGDGAKMEKALEKLAFPGLLLVCVSYEIESY